MKKGIKALIITVSVLLAVTITALSALLVLNHIGKLQFHREDTHINNDYVEIDDDTVIANGKQYKLNKNIVSILFIGVDKSDIKLEGGYGKNGQADCIFVAAIDTKKRKLTVIPISRETMVDINLYSTTGAYAGVSREQICLAYAYGNTPEESSSNVLKSVSRLLYGINIGSYIAIDTEGIGKFTELIGGVELSSLEDIVILGKDVYKGQKLTLSGKSALHYIKKRDSDIDANQRRMLRQKQFLKALCNKSGNLVLNNFSRLGTFYSEISPFLSTNTTFSQTTYLVSSCITLDMGSSMRFKSIEGTLNMGEKWVEFTPDEQSILDVVLETFYIEK